VDFLIPFLVARSLSTYLLLVLASDVYINFYFIANTQNNHLRKNNHVNMLSEERRSLRERRKEVIFAKMWLGGEEITMCTIRIQ